jgi:hypothetical protein
MIYKYCPPGEYTIKNLAAHTFYCRHAHDFNDPFEFWATVHDGLPPFDDDNERFRAIVAAWGFPGAKLKDIPLDHNTLIEYFGELRDGAPLIDLIYNRSRINCFSSDPRNLLMWSHYADGLRGCCLGFDAKRVAKESETVFITDVHYVTRPPMIDTLVYAVAEDLFNYAIDHGYEEYEGEQYRLQLNSMMAKALASKPVEWSYEKESRLIIHTRQDDRNPVLHQYPVDALKCVIIGEKCTDTFRTELRTILATLKVPVQTLVAARSAGCYELALQKIAI